MAAEFSIIEIQPEWVGNIEQLGSKPKFWFEYQDTNWLFKEVRPNTGEHWAEKVASEIAELLGLPTHKVELATFEDRIGCAVQTFLEPTDVLVHGNEVLSGAIDGYDKDKVRGQADHNFDNIVTVLEHLFTEPKIRQSESLQFVGYLVLDALVGNTDRHHENWGIRLSPTKHRKDGMPLEYAIEVAPTFDHASSLGRELLDDKRLLILNENEGMRRYIRKARGGIVRDSDARKGLSPMGVLEMIFERYPQLLKPWQNRVEMLETEKIEQITEQIPDEWMGETAKRFALAFIEESRILIKCIK